MCGVMQFEICITFFVDGLGERSGMVASGLTLMGEVLSYGFDWIFYNLAFLSYVFRVLSYGLRFLSNELLYIRLSPKRKVHSYGKQSACGLPSG